MGWEIRYASSGRIGYLYDRQKELMSELMIPAIDTYEATKLSGHEHQDGDIVHYTSEFNMRVLDWLLVPEEEIHPSIQTTWLNERERLMQLNYTAQRYNCIACSKQYCYDCEEEDGCCDQCDDESIAIARMLCSNWGISWVWVQRGWMQQLHCLIDGNRTNSSLYQDQIESSQISWLLHNI